METNAFSEADRHEVKDRYVKRFKENGYSEKALGWGEKGRRDTRYQKLASYWDLTGKTVLDVGAGFGDFYRIACNRGAAEYIGLELLPEFVAKGNSLYRGETNFSLIERDISIGSTLPDNDVSFISGLFNFKLQNGENYSFIEDILSKCFRHSSIGVSANFVTNRVDFIDPIMFYSDPCQVLEIAFRLTRKVVLLQDYFPFEFSIHLSKNDSFDPNISIFDEPII